MFTIRSSRCQRIRFHSFGLAVLLGSCCLAGDARADEPPLPEVGQGCLRIVPPDDRVSEFAACPLKHTEVFADISGFVGRTTVKQTFTNPTNRKIEAIYVFPLPQDAAVDQMTMIVGDRRIVAEIKEREAARQAYEQARAAGHVASLLDQERPNIFTQTLANIEPGATVEVELSFVETLRYENGLFTWVFPMVVGPRYVPGGGSAPGPMMTGRDTPRVPDGSRITPPIAPEGTRTGHDIGLTVQIDGGSARFGPGQIIAELHEIEHEPMLIAGKARLHLKNKDEIPNRDFVLRYRLGAEDAIVNAFLTHRDQRGDFFTLVLQPPKRIVPDAVVPRELVFVLDTSGSMGGFPIEKAKEVMSGAIDAMRPTDTFNLITFSGDTHILWTEPRPATPANVRAAQQFLATREGGGGTEMMKAIEAALIQQPRRAPTERREPGDAKPLSTDELMRISPVGRTVAVRLSTRELISWPPANVRSTWTGTAVQTADGPFEISGAPAGGDSMRQGAIVAHGSWTWSRDHDHAVLVVQRFEWVDDATPGPMHALGGPVRVVCFMTDGYVGNDMEIIAAVKQNAATTRVFSFGIGNSVNRFLLDGMAREGRGEVEYVPLNSNADASVKKFTERISAPVLTDIAIDWGGMAASEVYPKQIPDLFSAKPVVVHGRLSGAARGIIKLTGNTGVGRYAQEISLGDGIAAESRDCLASIWARAKVDDLMNRDLAAAQGGHFPEELKNQVIELGIAYRLMTQFTSFVAVEEIRVTSGGQPTTVRVPVEMPAGVRHEGIFGGGAGGGQQLFHGGHGQPAASARLGARRSGLTPQASPAPLERSKGRAAAADVARERRLDEGDSLNDAARPADKLDTALKSLAKRVTEAGKDGTYSDDGVAVTAWRTSVIIELANMTPETRQKLKELGFEELGSGAAASVVIGTIDVRKLEELVKIEAVARVRPMK